MKNKKGLKPNSLYLKKEKAEVSETNTDTDTPFIADEAVTDVPPNDPAEMIHKNVNMRTYGGFDKR